MLAGDYKRAPKVGSRVSFCPNPAARMFYGDARDPRPGEGGTVTTVRAPGGRRHHMPGPRGGLVYVEWDRHGTSGVFLPDLCRGGNGQLSGLDQIPTAGWLALAGGVGALLALAFWGSGKAPYRVVVATISDSGGWQMRQVLQTDLAGEAEARAAQELFALKDGTAFVIQGDTLVALFENVAGTVYPYPPSVVRAAEAAAKASGMWAKIAGVTTTTTALVVTQPHLVVS